MKRDLGLKVLLIDDSAVMRRALRRKLKGDARIQHLFEASNAADGYSLFKICRPDVVVLGLDLPDLHGLEILKKIKRRAPFCSVIILTSSDVPEMREACISSGADSFLNKGPSALSADDVIPPLWRSVRSRTRPNASAKRTHERKMASR